MDPRLAPFLDREEDGEGGDWEVEPSFDDFCRLSRVGRGGYGEVYKAQYHNKLYALKVAKGWSREAAALRKLHNASHVVRMHWDLGELPLNGTAPRQTAIALEYTPMGSIDTLVQKRGRLSNLEAASITQQVLEGLAAVHSAGIVHCDIKCANFLLFPNGKVKICDFGLCQILNTDKRDSFTHEGSIYWLAPELVRDHTQNYTPKSDIWSLGCAVLEMVKGNPPLVEYGYGKALHMLATLKSGADLFSTVESSSCRAFLQHCLQIDPMLRKEARKLLTLPWVKVRRDVLQYVEYGEEDEKDEKDVLLQKFQDNDSDAQMDIPINGLLLSSLQNASENQLKELVANPLRGQRWHIVKRDAVTFLILKISSSRCNLALQLANKVFAQDPAQLERFALSGKLPKLLEKPHTEELYTFVRLLSAHPHGRAWLSVAGAALNGFQSYSHEHENFTQ